MTEIQKKEERVKATHKVKKKTMGGFYAEFAKWSTRGKTHAELKLMVEDMRNCITHQKVRIRKLKKVIEFKQEDKQRDKNKLRSRVRSRDGRVEKLEKERERLKKEIRSLKVKLASKEKMIKLRDLKLSRLGTEKGIVALRLAKTKQVKQKVIKSEPTEGDRKLRNMLEKPLDKRMVNTSDLLVKVQKYASQNELTFQQINALTQIQILNNPTISDLVGISNNVITYLEDKNLIGKESLGIDDKRKYLYLTTEGERLANGMKNYFSYGKGLLDESSDRKRV